VTVNSTMKANSVFANYLALGEEGSNPASEHAALQNQTGNWGGTWLDFNRDSMTYKTYFINQRTEDTVSSGETPGGFRFLMYDYLNEFDMIPLDISQDAMTSTINFVCPKVKTESVEITGTSSNTFYGKDAGTAVTSGLFNTYLGCGARSLGASDGNENTYVGHKAGYYSAGGSHSNTCTGNYYGETVTSATPYTNGVYIGNSVTATKNADNEIVIGIGALEMVRVLLQSETI